MNIRDFRYLLAVAEHQHFGKAAQACFVSQPALSMQIQKLEETLGVQIFERSNKRVMITAIGQDIIQRVRSILRDIDDLQSFANTQQNPMAGTLRIGAFPTLAPYLLPTIVPPIHQQLPELRLLLSEEKTERLLEKLQSGVLDCALLALPINEDSLEATILFEDPFLLAVPPNHPLANRKRIRPQEVLNQSLLLLEEGHCLRAQALEFCRVQGNQQEQDFRATSMETLRQMVASGGGVTLIPELARQPHDGLAYIPFTKPAPSRTIGLVWRKSSGRAQCFEAIADIIRSCHQ